MSRYGRSLITTDTVTIPTVPLSTTPSVVALAEGDTSTTLVVNAQTTDYLILVNPNWDTTWKEEPGTKTAASVVISFNVPAPSGGQITWGAGR